MSTWILVVGSAFTAGVLIGAELFGRWWIRQRTRYPVRPPGMHVEMRQDPALCPEIDPRVRIEINADGERGGEVRGDEHGRRTLPRIPLAGRSARLSE